MRNILYSLVALCLVLTISACGDSGNSNSTSTSQTNLHPSVSLVADKTQVTADGVDGLNLTITVEDATGAPLAGQEVQLNVPLSLWFSNSPAAPLITDDNGQVAIFLRSSLHPLSDTPGMIPLADITVSCSGVISSPVRVSMLPGPRQTTASVTLVSDKVQAIADGRDKVTFTATVKDTNGAPIAGQSINFTSPPGTGPFIISPRYTDNNGVASVQITYPPTQSNTIISDFTMTAVSGGVTSNSVIITYTRAIPAFVTLVADRSQAIANGTDKIQFTATVKDGAGYIIPYQAIRFNVSPGANRYLSPINTNANGTAVMQLTAPPSSAPETIINVSVTSGSITSDTIVVSYTAPPQVTPDLVTLTSNKSTLIADGSDQVTFTIAATDSSGNPLVGQVVQLNLPYGPYISLTRRLTDTAGKSTATVTCYVNSTWPAPTTQTTIAITATVNGANSNAIIITVLPPS